jgi:hypothetical protein
VQQDQLQHEVKQLQVLAAEKDSCLAECAAQEQQMRQQLDQLRDQLRQAGGCVLEPTLDCLSRHSVHAA